jgi:hypothetical protein
VRTILGHIIVAAILLAGGEIFRRAAHIEDSLAKAEEDLATLAPEAADTAYATVEREMAVAGRLPFIGDPLLDNVRREHAMVAYYRGDYNSVPKETDLAAPDVTPDLVFLAANATFRNVAGRRAGQAGAQDLDGVLRMYTVLLKKSPDYVDGSFNYEYVVRLRNIVAKSKGNSSDPRAGQPNSDLAPPPAVHGEQGAPPENTPPEDFNVIVPLRPEERGELMKAGTGAARQRKG